MKEFFDKKGSFAVFALMAFCSMMILLSAIILSARNMAVDSAVNSLGKLWGKSILSEYDLELRDRYGLLGFYGDETSIEKKLNKYIKYSFDEKEYIDFSNSNCNLEGYQLTSTEMLKSQIEKIVVEGYKAPPREDSQDNNTVSNNINEGDRYINSQRIIKSLPSYSKTQEIYLFGIVDKIKSGVDVEGLFENALVDKYIFDFFTDYMKNGDLEKNYFKCEIEYIITGKLSDKKSKEDTEIKIKAMRNLLNLFYLYNCPEKRERALAVAAAITPTGTAVLTQAVILEAWAWAESLNDLQILHDNKTVPLLKNDDNWALSIENAINNISFDENEKNRQYIEPQKCEGQTYSDYLKVLLCGLPEKTKLLRIMDLIQINMKFTYCEYFLLKDYHCGLNYSLKVNGKTYEFEDQY